MANPTVELYAPTEITVEYATLNGRLLDNAGKRVHCVFSYRRSGKRAWQGHSAGWFTDAPHDLAARIKTKWPTLQHECLLSCHWYEPFPGGSVSTDIIRFWFIPASLRAKGAPFLVTAFDIQYDHRTITLTVTTDIPVRLSCKISTIAPYSMAAVDTKRGRAFKHHPVLVWQWQWQAGQQERGDTLEHTIVWEAPRFCNVYHLQCWGTTDSKTSPSRSPFFRAHPPIPGFEPFFLEPWTFETTPPEWELIITEPWTFSAQPPVFAILFIEPWTS